jgi:hypothetical protein
MVVHHDEPSRGAGAGHAWEEENGGTASAVSAGGWGLSMPQKFDRAVGEEDAGQLKVDSKDVAEWRDVTLPEEGATTKDSVWPDKMGVV